MKLHEWLVEAYDHEHEKAVSYRVGPNSLVEIFAHFTECQLATVEGMHMLSRPPKGELRRHEHIAVSMLSEGNRYGLTVEIAERVKCGRTAEALELLAEHRPRSFKPAAQNE